MANPDINSRCAERGIRVDNGFSMPQLHSPTGKVAIGHPAGKRMRKCFPKPPMIVADRIGFLTGNGKQSNSPSIYQNSPRFAVTHPSPPAIKIEQPMGLFRFTAEKKKAGIHRLFCKHTYALF